MTTFAVNTRPQLPTEHQRGAERESLPGQDVGLGETLVNFNLGSKEHRFPMGTSIGASLTFSTNDYPQASPLPCPVSPVPGDESRYYTYDRTLGLCVEAAYDSDPDGDPNTPPPDPLPSVDPGQLERQDRAFLLEGYANLVIRDHVSFRLSVVKNRKYSNFPQADYNATVYFGGFVLGWN